MSTPIHQGRGSVWIFRAQIALVIVTLALALGTTGCGGHTTATSAINPTTVTPTDCYTNGTCLPPGTGSGTGGSGGIGPDPTPDEFANATQLNFTLNGTNSGNETYTSAPFDTDNLLKVRIVGLPGGPNSGVGNTNFTANYLCVGYTVSVLGQAVDTKPLAVNGGVIGMCQNGGSQVIDFSSRLSPGHGPITITVSKPRYDWYCMLYTYYPWLMGGTATMYCPLHPVYQYHTINGEIQVETNGTNSP
jgi:hypothetical protein